MFGRSGALVAALATIVSFVAAAPVDAEKRIVFEPQITSPHAGQVAYAGQPLEVTWNTDNIPSELQNASIAEINLGYLVPGELNEHLNWVLNDGKEPAIPYSVGHTTVQLPSHLKERTTYVVNIIGDSGDISDKFTIKHKA